MHALRIRGVRFVCCAQLSTSACRGKERMYTTWSNVSNTWSQLVESLRSTFSNFFNFNESSRKLTIAVEGNIGSGKTELLKYFENSPLVQTYIEPVNKWRNIRGENALKLMYEDPSRWALTFQTYVQLTMLETHIEKQKKPVKLMERSIYSARYCFVDNLHKKGHMPDIEYVVLNRWFEWIISNMDCHLDLIVYLQTNPETVHERIKKRCRREEEAIPLDYLTALHNLHEEWLVKKTSYAVPCPVLVLDGNKNLQDMHRIYENNRSQILCGCEDS